MKILKKLLQKQKWLKNWIVNMLHMRTKKNFLKSKIFEFFKKKEVKGVKNDKIEKIVP